MKKTLLITFIVLLNVLLIGCGKPDIEGIVLEVNDDGVKLATELSPAEYEKIKDESVLDIQNEDVNGSTSLGLIDLNYEHTDKFSKGDEVEVWMEGDIMTSYPSKAKAKKISKKY
ncbi:DUF3221 domain-containing protein [Ornithinibacillus sp. 4-3]|uniref:DUF3221 domain-containing protein n=1 Tax=Ornithinibacillus sp. 4-3 TaxID=3231488 RepID=A0AB39HSQ6_9BACI